MTYLEKLTEIISQEKDIEKDLKELKFGWVIEDNRCQYKLKKILSPLELYHLIRYCINKEVCFAYSNVNMETHINIGWEIIKYDFTKPLHKQSEEVLKNIFEALID